MDSLKKGKQIELSIESLAPGGEGVSKDFSVPVFINKAAPGDRLLVEIYDNRRTFAKASLLKVIEPGKERVEAPCKLFKVCGGCQWMHLSYEGQLSWKKAIIEQSLRHVGGQDIGDLCIPVVLPTVGAQKTFAYRNKVQLPVRNPNQSKRLLAGYFETNSHNLVNIKHCPIQPGLLDEVLAEIKLLAEKYGISAYDEKTEKGLLRHIQMRFSQARQTVLVTLVLNCAKQKIPDRLKNLAGELTEKFSAIKGVCVNCNEKKGNRILGEEIICLSGESFIEEVLQTDREEFPDILRRGLTFRLSPLSFFQVNTRQAEILLELIADEVREYIKQSKLIEKSGDHPLSADMTLLDAYAGVGTIALWLAPFVSKVLAVESNIEAVKDGKINQSLNKIDNVQFYESTVEEFLPQLLTEKTSVEIMVLDPPRQGLSPAVIESIVKLQPQLIIYVSCNPVTLARDLKLILNQKSDCQQTPAGYKVEKIVPIDLFPQTYHIESITVLKRK